MIQHRYLCYAAAHSLTADAELDTHLVLRWISVQWHKWSRQQRRSDVPEDFDARLRRMYLDVEVSA